MGTGSLPRTHKRALVCQWYLPQKPNNERKYGSQIGIAKKGTHVRYGPMVPNSPSTCLKPCSKAGWPDFTILHPRLRPRLLPLVGATGAYSVYPNLSLVLRGAGYPWTQKTKHPGGGRCSPGIVGWPMFPHPQHKIFDIQRTAYL